MKGIAVEPRPDRFEDCRHESLREGERVANEYGLGTYERRELRTAHDLRHSSKYAHCGHPGERHLRQRVRTS